MKPGNHFEKCEQPEYPEAKLKSVEEGFPSCWITPKDEENSGRNQSGYKEPKVLSPTTEPDIAAARE
ncbi:hypothetical protein GCM10025872_27220 [Barrientosiimonas endolithica]|uniref:Uncharacterized protein n=1 Tax=Barrientosiimonas endolithica TaxID=1535208 RepID=A0ABN6YNY0_9MICO|nr:hypothetical protein GCM10025872_27220 [Barrientosiimonas endolithica]